MKAAHDLLRELIGQDFDIDQDGVPRLHRGTRRADHLDGRSGDAPWPQEQPAALRWLQASAAATNGSEPLIVAVHVEPGRRAGRAAGQAPDRRQPREQRPQRILGDTAYGNGPVRAELAERDVEVLAPVPEGKVEEDCLASTTSRSTWTPARSPARAGTPSRSAPPRRGFARELHHRDVPRLPAQARAAARARPRRQIRIMEHEHLLQAGRRALGTRPPASIYAAPDRGSNGCSGCSPTATALARAATSAARKHDCRPRGPPRWSTSTRSDTASAPRAPEKQTDDRDDPPPDELRHDEIRIPVRKSGHHRTHFFRGLLA